MGIERVARLMAMLGPQSMPLPTRRPDPRLLRQVGAGRRSSGQALAVPTVRRAVRIDRLTAQDVAAAIGALHDDLGALVLTYCYWPGYRGEQALQRRIVQRLLPALYRFSVDALELPASDRRPDSLSRLAAAVLDEYAHCEHCAECAGFGQAWTADEGITWCKACGGGGLTPRGQVKRARALGVRTSSYARCWRRSYDHALSVLHSVSWRAACRIESGLGG